VVELFQHHVVFLTPIDAIYVRVSRRTVESLVIARSSTLFRGIKTMEISFTVTVLEHLDHR
jgi:hypothetical protein